MVATYVGAASPTGPLSFDLPFAGKATSGPCDQPNPLAPLIDLRILRPERHRPQFADTWSANPLATTHELTKPATPELRIEHGFE